MDFPTVGSFQGGIAGGVEGEIDAFVSKIDPAGGGLVYSTYLGGTRVDVGTGIDVDATGSAYVTGYTASTDFPVQAAWQPLKAGGLRDGFVAKLDPSGASLVYSTYLGGGSHDECHGIALDGSGSACVTGQTASVDFPVADAIREIFNGAQRDAFVTKFTPTGDGLVFSTYLGGTGDNRGFAIDVDDTGAIHVTGRTESSDFPVVAAPQPDPAGGRDAFVVKLAATGESFLLATYLGGNGDDAGLAIAADGLGGAVVVGETGSPDFPSRAPLQSRFGGGEQDAFVARIPAGGGTLTYATLLGGSGEDGARAVALNGDGAAFVTGFTGSVDFPTRAPLQGGFGGGLTDLFVVEVPPSGGPPAYATLIGGTSTGGTRRDEGGFGIAAGAGGTYVAGFTYADDFPSVAGFQPAYAGGNGDAVLLRLDPESVDETTLSVDVRFGRVVDRAAPASDTVKVVVRLTLPGTGALPGFDPMRDGLSVLVQARQPSVRLDVPPGDAGWKTVRGRHVWRSPAGTSPAWRVAIDRKGGRIRAVARDFDFDALPGTPVEVAVRLANETGFSWRPWGVPRSLRRSVRLRLRRGR